MWVIISLSHSYFEYSKSILLWNTYLNSDGKNIYYYIANNVLESFEQSNLRILNILLGMYLFNIQLY